jgi:hypothetical protein
MGFAMRKTALLLSILGAILVILHGTSAQAQATRTWVSGVGDDANPCSRTAPCKTFAGAISKTAPKGEINVLDPGGFGAVTITKSITISSEGSEAGVLVSGTNGIVVSAAPTDVVILRGLDIEGLGTGLSGIVFNSGSALHVERCTIRGFTQFGIVHNTPTTSDLYVSDSIISENNTAGVEIQPSSPGVASVILDRVQVENNASGFRTAIGAGASANVTIRLSHFAGNTGGGITARSSGGALQVMLFHIASTFNGIGIDSDGAQSILRIDNSTVTGNGTGLTSVNGGALLSYGNNQVAGNTTDGAPTGPQMPK